MPHAHVVLVDGVNTNRTPTLNQYGISSSQSIRFQYDNQNNILVQKLGGWQRYYPTAMQAVVRALWAWETTEARAFLAVGTRDITGRVDARLNAISNGVLADITPRQSIDDIAPVATSVAGNSIVTITDTTVTNVTRYDAVYIPTHIAVGGLVLFGLYPCDPDGHLAGTTYTVQATDRLGNPLPAPSSSSSPVLAQFSTTNGSVSVTVTLPNHGYGVGDAFPVLIPTAVGGATFFGHYPIQSVTSANAFVITASQTPSASTTGYVNNGNAQFIYNFDVGALPTGTGWGAGGYGSGGYGGVFVPGTGDPIGATDWTLDNWGEILIACAASPPIVLTTTSASGTGATGTLHFAEPYVVPVGGTIVVANVTPTTWNGTYLVTGSSSGSVSFATAITAAMTGAGTITVLNAAFSPVYAWDAESGSPTAAIIALGPPVNGGCFVAMPQRQIVAWGSTFTGVPDPLLLRWCDVNNFDVWIGQPTNQAGSYRLPTGSRIVGAIQGPQQAYAWTDIDVWAMQYIGPPLVYGFNKIGTGCGLIAKKAAASVNGAIYWMGPSQFFVMGGSGVEPLACSVWDVAFQNLDTSRLDLIRVAVNSRFNEISWFFPTLAGSGAVDTYVKYNYQLGLWDYGSLPRSAWIDQSVAGPPVGADPTTLLLQQHETSPDADGAAMLASFRTGYFTLEDGNELTFVDQMWPDMKWGLWGGSQGATIMLSFCVANYPGDTPRTYGPFSLTQNTKFITPRFRGRLISLQLASNDVGSFWRMGMNRYRWQPDGRF